MTLIYYFISLLIGFLLFYFYLKWLDKGNIIKYPNLSNPEDTIYIDDNNVCYRYFKQEVT